MANKVQEMEDMERINKCTPINKGKQKNGRVAMENYLK